MENSELLVCVGKRIRMLRKEKGLSQEQLSERANLHPTSVSGIERGKVNGFIGNYANLAHALNVPLAELVDTSTNFGDIQLYREAQRLLDRVQTLDDKRRAVYLDSAMKLFERIESL